jgi:uncharacterized protein (DUF1800 family)
VMELARCLTGWGVKEHFWRGEFTFNPEVHEPGEKVVLGVGIQASGLAEAEQVIEHLAIQPATANFIVQKLAKRFLGDDPPKEIMEKTIKTFETTAGDIRATLRTLLLDGLKEVTPKYRRPVNFVAAGLRLLNAESDCGAAVQHYLLRMGQPPFNWPTPDGYPDYSEAWQGNLMPRWQFGFALAGNNLEKTAVDLPALLSQVKASTPDQAVDALSSLLLGNPLPISERDILLSSLNSEGVTDEQLLPIVAGGLLASPAFQWR